LERPQKKRRKKERQHPCNHVCLDKRGCLHACCKIGLDTEFQHDDDTDTEISEEAAAGISEIAPESLLPVPLVTISVLTPEKISATDSSEKISKGIPETSQ